MSKVVTDILRVWHGIYGTSIVFALLALYFAVKILDWVQGHDKITAESQLVLVTALVSGIVGHFTGIAVARTTPQPEPGVPQSTHDATVKALLEAKGGGVSKDDLAQVVAKTIQQVAERATPKV